MKKQLTVLLAVMILFAPAGAAQATVTDNFDSYSTGALSAVSGGTWRTWNGTGTDAQVVAEGNSAPNALVFTTAYEDVVTYNSGNLLASGTASFSADFYIKSGIAQLALNFAIGSGNSAANSINYTSGMLATIIAGGYGSANNEVHLWNSATGAFPLLTTVTLDAWHNVTVVAAGSSGTFDVYIDGIKYAGNYSFMSAFTDSNGFNALEIYTGYVGGSGNPAAGSYLVDNISLTGSAAAVPVPAAFWLLGSGLAGLIGLRRKSRQ